MSTSLNGLKMRLAYLGLCLTLTTCVTTQSSPNTNSLICGTANKVLDVQREFDKKVSSVTAIKFVDDEHLNILVWTSLTETLPTGFVGFNSTRQDLVITLSARQVSTLSKTYSPLRQICNDQCLSKVIDQSPNQEWQLMQVWTVEKSLAGMWLIGSNATQKLADFVPVSATWQWSSGSSRLLFIHPQREYGLSGVMVDIAEGQPKIIPLDMTSPRPGSYSLIESDGSLAYADNYSQAPTLNIYSSNNGGLSKNSSEPISDYVRPIWITTTSELFLLRTISTSIELESKSKALIFRLPMTTKDQGSIEDSVIAISPSKTRLAVVDKYSRVFTYDCK